MINIECSQCQCDLNYGDLVYCEACFVELHDHYEALEEELETLRKENKVLREGIMGQKEKK